LLRTHQYILPLLHHSHLSLHDYIISLRLLVYRAVIIEAHLLTGF
jgi:hypothetical protein